MNVFFVINRQRDWPFEIPGATTVPARTYLTDPAYAENRSARVLNLCRTDRYQSRGYYVSLLAEARGHHPLPEIRTIEDLQADDLTHLVGASFNEQIQQLLAGHSGDLCEINVYFGREPSGQYNELAQQLFNLLHAPLVRATFERNQERWRLRNVRILSAANIAREHRAFVAEAAAAYITPNNNTPVREAPRVHPSIAILYNEGEPDPPSNPRALEKFRRVAEALGMRVQFITRNDGERLPEFDALFIRDTTWISHYTYQFARRAVAEGLVVIDDPDSILKCNNKVFLNELLNRYGIPTPKTLMVHRSNVDQIIPMLGLPCILKKPDSAFSLGVAKIHSREALPAALDALFAKSELIIAQEWVPTEFDWRVGILDRRPLYVCKYMMAPGHWQVIKREMDRKLEGSTIALSVGEAPEVVVKTALKAANLIGDGLYGVDIKQVRDECYVIEVNDNPNIDAGNEDGVLKDALYREVMGVFLRRIHERSRGASR